MFDQVVLMRFLHGREHGAKLHDDHDEHRISWNTAVNQ
jgi:hypothetical protein